MRNAYRYEYNGKLYTKEEMQEIRAENCKSNGRRKQDVEDYNEAVSFFGKIAFVIIIAIYALIPIIEAAVLG